MKKKNSGSGGASKQPAVRKRYVSVNSREKQNANEHETVKPGFTFGSEKSGSGYAESGRSNAGAKRSNSRRSNAKSKRSTVRRGEKNKAEKTRAYKAAKNSGNRNKNNKKKRRKRQPRGRLEYYRFEKIVWAVLGSFVLLAGLALGARLIIDRMFRNDYNNFRYEKAVREEKLLIRVNFPEGYVPFYNIGCAYYEMGEYQQAEAWFRRALRQGAPHGVAQGKGNVSSGNPSEGSTNEKPSEGSTQAVPDLGAPTRASAGAGFFSANNADAECDVRVNVALSIIGQIDSDLLDTESGRTKAIEKLQNARSVLTAEGCASADDEGGHDEAAVQLRDEIDEWLSRLRGEDQNPENKEDDSDDSNDGQDNSSGQDSDGGNSTDQSDESGGNGNSGENASGGSSGEDSDNSNSGSGNSSGSGSGSGGGSGSSDSTGGSDIDENRIRREIERSMEESREEQRQSEEDEKYYEYYYYGNGDEGNGGIWW